jgi:hypothetical protein
MINNYDKVYNEYIELFVEFHNAHMHFKRRPSHESSLRLKRALAAIEAHVSVFRAEIRQFRESYTLEQKKIWQEHKQSLRDKEIARARKRELKNQRK